MWWKRTQRDFQAEIEAHLRLETDELRSEGLTPAEAEAAARRAFGNRTLAEERFNESGRWMFLDHLGRDLRFAARVLKKDAGFSALAILGLALGIGVSTAIFALVNAAIRSSDDAAVQDRASYVGLNKLVNGRRRGDSSYLEYRYYQDNAKAFRGLKAESGREEFILSRFSRGKAGSEAEDVQGRFESANFLAVTGLQPALGRSFSAEEEKMGGVPVALLSYGSWKRLFGGDASVVGRTVILNGHAVMIIGISDARYHVADPSDFYLPLALQPILLNQGDWLRDSEKDWLMLEARLQPGVSASQAQAEVDALSSALAKSGSVNPDGGVLITPGGGNPEKRRELAASALAVILVVSMILLIACFNLANLLLARAVVRRREIGVRLSLGASRARVICQLLTESMLLSFAGAGLGLLLSHWLVTSLVVLLKPLPGFELRLDPLVVLYSIALAWATGLSFGLAPALAATRTDLARALHSESLSETPSPRSWRIWSPRNALVIAPLAVSLMLLIGAGMTVRLVQRMYRGGPTFDAARLIGISFRLNLQGYDEARTHQFQENLRERIGMMPGITSVALVSAMPLVNRMGWFPFLVEGSGVSPGGSSPHTDYNIVSAAFFKTMDASVVVGRAFTSADREGSPPVAIVNQALVRRYWSDEEPIGKRVRLAAGRTSFEIIGVAPDLQDPNAPFNSVRPTVYIPFGQGKLFLKGSGTPVPPHQMQFLIRTNGERQDIQNALRREALAIDSSLRVNVQALEEILEARRGPIKTTSMLLTALGALALVMASVGIYGILAYAVSRRTREIGVRMALGAQRNEILALVMQRTLMLITWGIGLGLVGALALNRILSSAIADVGGFDTVTYASVALFQGAVAILASYLPARKALLVDPVQALHYE